MTSSTSPSPWKAFARSSARTTAGRAPQTGVATDLDLVGETLGVQSGKAAGGDPPETDELPSEVGLGEGRPPVPRAVVGEIGRDDHRGLVVDQGQQSRRHSPGGCSARFGTHQHRDDLRVRRDHLQEGQFHLETVFGPVGIGGPAEIRLRPQETQRPRDRQPRPRAGVENASTPRAGRAPPAKARWWDGPRRITRSRFFPSRVANASAATAPEKHSPRGAPPAPGTAPAGATAPSIDSTWDRSACGSSVIEGAGHGRRAGRCLRRRGNEHNEARNIRVLTQSVINPIGRRLQL